MDKKMNELLETITSDVVKAICNACSLNGKENKCPLSGLFKGDVQRTIFHQKAGICVCGAFYHKLAIVPCRVCQNIRNGECDGPREHCADTQCPHRFETVCPVSIDKCSFVADV